MNIFGPLRDDAVRFEGEVNAVPGAPRSLPLRDVGSFLTRHWHLHVCMQDGVDTGLVAALFAKRGRSAPRRMVTGAKARVDFVNLTRR